VSGGNGGAKGGTGPDPSPGGVDNPNQGLSGSGGYGIVGGGLSLTINDIVSGGLSGRRQDPVRASALYFTGGANSLAFGTGGSLVGGITIAGGSSPSAATIAGKLSDGIFVNGTLRLASSGAAGGIGNVITTTGSVISYANGIDNPTPIVLNSNTTQLEVLNSDVATQSGVISQTGGSRPIQKIGSGTLILTAVNTYTGGTTIAAGTLQLSGAGQLGGGLITFTGGSLRATRIASSPTRC
jgi:autotransporter-associated beta strand protein